MPTRKVKLVVGCILLVLFVLGALYFLRSMNTREQEQNFSSKLAAEVEKKRSSDNVVEIRFSDLADFKWDRVYIFTPYTPTKRIDEDLGYVWQPARSIDISVRDDINLLIFTNTGKVVFYVEHPRNLGDLDGNYKQGGYSPDEAIFRVVEGEKQDNGLPWLRMKWKMHNK